MHAGWLAGYRCFELGWRDRRQWQITTQSELDLKRTGSFAGALVSQLWNA
jgi:hypothetical protein